MLLLREKLPLALCRSDPLAKRRRVRLCEDGVLEGEKSSFRRKGGTHKDVREASELFERFRRRWCWTVPEELALLMEEHLPRSRYWCGSRSGLLAAKGNAVAMSCDNVCEAQRSSLAGKKKQTRYVDWCDIS